MKKIALALASLLASLCRPAAAGAEESEDPCADLRAPADTVKVDYGTCETPRIDTVTGGSMALDIGVVWYTEAAEKRGKIGTSAMFDLRGGIAFWDQLVFGLSFGVLTARDLQPYSEQVVDCETIEGVVVSCDDDPYAKESEITSPGFLSLETGYQLRIRPSSATSLVPSLLVGYLQSFSGLKRGVVCDGCEGEQALDVSPSGGYVAPMLRMTFGRIGMWAVALRSQWFLSGDLERVTTLGAEFGLP